MIDSGRFQPQQAIYLLKTQLIRWFIWFFIYRPFFQRLPASLSDIYALPAIPKILKVPANSSCITHDCKRIIVQDASKTFSTNTITFWFLSYLFFIKAGMQAAMI